MRTYEQARALIGSTLEASVTNGRTKRLKFREDADGNVQAVLFDTAVVTFTPHVVRVMTGGWVTPTTFDGIAAALDVPRAVAGTANRVPTLLGHTMSEGMALAYDGSLIYHTATRTPLAKGRK